MGGVKKEFVLHVWVHQLLCDVVEEVPASIGEGPLEEGQSYKAHVIVLERREGVGRLQPVVFS